MSEYTTQVRFICEQKAGYTESKGANDIDAVIAASWDKIFNKSVAFFDPDYKSVICQKILRHYYLREIGAETAGIWIFWMNTVLSEIMPYYNKLYASALLEFDPFNDVDYTRTGSKAGNENGKTEANYQDEGRGTTNRTTSDSGTRENYDLFSDTPQGSLIGVNTQTYLTNARKNTDDVKNNGESDENTTSQTSGSRTETRDGNTTEQYLERVAGKMNSISYSELLQKYRDTFINIDMLVIKEFEDCFMGLW